MRQLERGITDGQLASAAGVVLDGGELGEECASATRAAPRAGTNTAGTNPAGTNTATGVFRAADATVTFFCTLSASRRTAIGGLSSRNPRYTGCRSLPSGVHSVKRTWATSTGSTQCAGSGVRGTGPSNGERRTASGRSFADTFCNSPRVNPPPHNPA